MAGEEEKKIPENNQQQPADEELFVGDVQQQFSERDVFAGDENLYKILENAASSPTAPTSSTSTQSTYSPDISPAPIKTGYKRFSHLQIALAAAIFMIAAVLSYALLRPPKTSRRNNPLVTTAAQQTPAVEITKTQQKPAQSPLAEPDSAPAEPVSLQTAEMFYGHKDYDNALKIYNQLFQRLQISSVLTTIENQLLRDFIQLRMALCMKLSAADNILRSSDVAGNIEQADGIFRTLSDSRSPIVRLMSDYHLIFSEIRQKQYMKAVTRTYRVAALIDAVDFSHRQSLSLRRDCHFITAACLTRNVLCLSDRDKDIPEQLWGQFQPPEPFSNLNESRLRLLLSYGDKKLTKALLGPQIQALDYDRWSVTCSSASIEELLGRFAANTGLTVNWLTGPESAQLRKRPVTLHTQAISTQKFIPTCVGCTGLIAQFDGEDTVNIYNPHQYSSLPQHLSILNKQAVSLWRQFLILFDNDEDMVNAHFAIAQLQAQRNQPSNAIAEYKLVVNKFPNTPFAPFALLHSSMLKTGLRDYHGAREDLRQLTEQYPDSVVTARSYLYLADATMKSGLKAKAAKLYAKVYHLGLSFESKAASTLSAGKCFYDRGEYKDAIKWFDRYIKLTANKPGYELSTAYLLSGKSHLAMGNSYAACENLQKALAEKPAEKEFLATISALTAGYSKEHKFLEAYSILENIPNIGLSQKAIAEILLLKCQCLRAMGMTDSVIALIADRPAYTFDLTLRAGMYFELAKCHRLADNPELAVDNLTKILTFIEPGRLMQLVTVELADIHLELGQYTQSISICRQLLQTNPPDDVRQQSLNILAMVYKKQKKYDKAASILLGKWDSSDNLNNKISYNQPPNANQRFTAER